MIEFTPAELRIIFNEVQSTIDRELFYEEQLPLFESIEQKIAKELNIRTAGHEEI